MNKIKFGSLLLASLAVLSLAGSNALSADASHVRGSQVHRTYNGHKARAHRNDKILPPHDISSLGLISFTKGHRSYHDSLANERYINTKMSRRFINRTISRENNDINKYRLYYGLKTLKPDPRLVSLANLRAEQCNHKFSHYNDQHQVMVWKDADRMMMGRSYANNRHSLGENISKTGKLAGARENLRHAEYYFRHPSWLADTNVFDLMNNDKADHDNHRRNILNPKYRYFGVGDYYNHRTHALYIVTVFSTHAMKARA